MAGSARRGVRKGWTRRARDNIHYWTPCVCDILVWFGILPLLGFRVCGEFGRSRRLSILGYWRGRLSILGYWRSRLSILGHWRRRLRKRRTMVVSRVFGFRRRGLRIGWSAVVLVLMASTVIPRIPLPSVSRVSVPRGFVSGVSGISVSVVSRISKISRISWVSVSWISVSRVPLRNFVILELA